MKRELADLWAVWRAAITGGDPVAVLLDRRYYREREDRR